VTPAIGRSAWGVRTGPFTVRRRSNKETDEETLGGPLLAHAAFLMARLSGQAADCRYYLKPGRNPLNRPETRFHGFCSCRAFVRPASFFDAVFGTSTTACSLESGATVAVPADFDDFAATGEVDATGDSGVERAA
jgi:hypothetical protein